MKKMEEEKRRKQEELKRLTLCTFLELMNIELLVHVFIYFENLYSRKRDERIRRVLEAKVKEEQREEEKKKKIEQKMANIDEKNEKVYSFCSSKEVKFTFCSFYLILSIFFPPLTASH